MNALSSGSVLTQPTESELQRDKRTSWWTRAASQLEVWKLHTLLAFFDAMFAYRAWRYGHEEAAREPHENYHGNNPG